MNERASSPATTTFYYGFLPNGDLRVEANGIRPEVQTAIGRLQPAVLAAMQRNDYATATRVALEALGSLADELRPAWAESLGPNQAFMQAVMVEVGCSPTDRGSLPSASRSGQSGAAVWVTYRAWVATRAEALSVARRMGVGSGPSPGSGRSAHTVNLSDGQSTAWIRAWI